MSQICNYQDKLMQSKIAVSDERWELFYKGFFGPDAVIGDRIPDNTDLQKSGVDRQIRYWNGSQFNVDEKIILKTYPHICFETVSNVELNKPGWFADTTLLTDYLAYTIFPFEDCYFIDLNDARIWWQSPRGQAATANINSKSTKTPYRGGYYTTIFYPVPIETLMEEFGEHIKVTLTPADLEYLKGVEIE